MTVHLGLLSNYFYLRVSYLSTAFTSTQPLLIVSKAGKDMYWRVTLTLAS